MHVKSQQSAVKSVRTVWLVHCCTCAYHNKIHAHMWWNELVTVWACLDYAVLNFRLPIVNATFRTVLIVFSVRMRRKKCVLFFCIYVLHYYLDIILTKYISGSIRVTWFELTVFNEFNGKMSPHFNFFRLTLKMINVNGFVFFV